MPRVDYNSTLRVEALACALGVANTESEGFINCYPRYWHGYMIFLKPLLCIFDIAQIRLLMMCLVLGITGITCVIVYRRLGLYYLIGLLYALMIINPVTVSMSMQFLNVYVVSLISLDILLLCPTRRGGDGYVFLFTGIAIAYFDFLTYPITALGLPLCVYLAKLKDQRLSYQICKLLEHTVIWGFGYVGMWAGKWIVTYLFTGFNAILDGISRVQFHSKLDNLDIYGNPISSFEAVQMNFNVLKAPYIYFALCSALIVIFFSLLRKRHVFKPSVGKTALFLCIGFIPFAWYVFAKTIHMFIFGLLTEVFLFGFYHYFLLLVVTLLLLQINNLINLVCIS